MSKQSSYIQIPNSFIEEKSPIHLEPKELYLYSLLLARRSPFLDCTETTVNIITDNQTVYKDKNKPERNKKNVKEVIFSLQDKGFITIQHPEKLNYNSTLTILFNGILGGYEEMYRDIYDRATSPEEMYVLYVVKRFNKVGCKRDYEQWARTLNCSVSKIEQLIPDMLDRKLIYRVDSTPKQNESGQWLRGKDTYYVYENKQVIQQEEKNNQKHENKVDQAEIEQKIEAVIEEEAAKVDPVTDSKYPFPLHQENNQAKKAYLDKVYKGDDPFDVGPDYKKHRNNGLSSDFVHMWDIPMSDLTVDDYVYYLIQKDVHQQFRKIADKRIAQISKSEKGRNRLEINMSQAQDVVDEYMTQKRRDDQAFVDNELKELINLSECTVVTFTDGEIGELTDDFPFDEVKYVHYLEDNYNGTYSIAKVQPMDLIYGGGSKYRKFSDNIKSEIITKFMELFTQNKIDQQLINALRQYVDDLCHTANIDKSYDADWEGDEWICDIGGNNETNTSMQDRRRIENKKKEKKSLLHNELMADIL